MGQPQQNAQRSSTPIPGSFEDYLAQEDTRAAAEKALLDAPYAAPPPQSMRPPEEVDTPADMPPEVFKELARRLSAAPKGSDERNFGVETMDQGGKHYKYDAYAAQEAAGYPRDRTVGGGANFMQRLAQNFGPNPQQVQQNNVNEYRAQGAERLRMREMDADETYRQAMMASQEHTRQDSRRRALVEIQGRAYDRAVNRYTQSLPRASNRTQSQEGLDSAQAALAQAEADAIAKGRTKNGGIPGGKPKPDFTPDQAYTNMRQAETDLRDIDSEINQLQNPPASGKHWFSADDPIPVYHGNDSHPYRTVNPEHVPMEIQRLRQQRDDVNARMVKFRSIVANGNGTDAETGDDPVADKYNDDDLPPSDDGDDPNDPGGWNGASKVPAGSIDPDQAGKLAKAPPSKSGVPTAGAGRRPQPPPEILKTLPYRDQMYYEIIKNNPGMSDREAKVTVKNIIAQGGQPRGSATPAKPAPTTSTGPRY